MEDIAAAADVSVGTLYNYFGSKVVLQLAVFEEETAAIVGNGAGIISDPGDDPVAAVERLFDGYLDGFFSIDRRLLLDVFRAGFDRTEMLPGLVSLDLLILQQLGELMGNLAVRGLIRSERVEDAVLLLYSSLVTVLLLFLTIDGMGQEDIRSQARRLVETAFHGLNPD